jgi:hypothetical protein
MQCFSLVLAVLLLFLQAIVSETEKNVHEKHVAHARAARRVPRVRVCRTKVDEGTQGAFVQE